jgi:hypothetical protein
MGATPLYSHPNLLPPVISSLLPVAKGCALQGAVTAFLEHSSRSDEFGMPKNHSSRQLDTPEDSKTLRLSPGFSPCYSRVKKPTVYQSEHTDTNLLVCVFDEIILNTNTFWYGAFPSDMCAVSILYETCALQVSIIIIRHHQHAHKQRSFSKTLVHCFYFDTKSLSLDFLNTFCSGALFWHAQESAASWRI